MTKYTIVGGGAIGGTIAYALTVAGHDIHIIDQDAAHVAAIVERGLTLRSSDGDHTVAISASLPAATPDSLERVILAVKAQATAAAMRWIGPRLAPDGFVVSLQNGFNESEIAAVVGPERVLPAFVNLFADVLGPGIIRDGGGGALVVGEMDGRLSERIVSVVADLQAWGPAVASSNVDGYLWAKSGFGAMLSATALANDAMAELLNRHRASAHSLAAEIYRVADAKGIILESFDAFTPEPYRTGIGADAATDRLVAWLRTQSKDRSGIWRDLAVRRRPTEVAHQYEELIASGMALGIEMPVLRALLVHLRELEQDPDTMSESRLDSLDRHAESSAAMVAL